MFPYRYLSLEMKNLAVLICLFLICSSSCAPVVKRKTAQEYYQDYNFDPNGPGERTNAWRHLFKAFAARRLANQATSKAEQLYPRSQLHNGPGDAFRHAYWNYLMASQFGVDLAKKFGDSHERKGSGSGYGYGGVDTNAIGEVIMDLHNNREGRRLWEENKDSNAAVGIIQDNINRLITSPVHVD